jgi:hypothetical protein
MEHPSDGQRTSISDHVSVPDPALRRMSNESVGTCSSEVPEYPTHTPTPPPGPPTRHPRCALLSGPGGLSSLPN